MNNPNLAFDMAEIRRKELEDWAKRERLARAATQGQPSWLTRLMTHLSKITLSPAKPTRKRSRKMHKAIPTNT